MRERGRGGREREGGIGRGSDRKKEAERGREGERGREREKEREGAERGETFPSHINNTNTNRTPFQKNNRHLWI